MRMGDMNKAMKQVAKLQADMARMQEELGGARVEASSGGGAVRAVANGHGELVELSIDPAAVDPADVAMLADMVMAAVNEAQRNARAMSEEKMKALTGGLKIPGLSF
jgi:DNA-binding YbaB/EbfC family protein